MVVRVGGGQLKISCHNIEPELVLLQSKISTDNFDSSGMLHDFKEIAVIWSC